MKKERPYLKKSEINMCKIITYFSTEVNIKLCPYAKKII
jgi:hypothetical protein